MQDVTRQSLIRRSKVHDDLRGGTPSDSRRVLRGFAMHFKDWEVTIQQIVDEANYEPREPGKNKVLKAWRAKLEKEPTSLPPLQMDEIVPVVRKWRTVASR